ncbi:MAG: hypothetical protein CBE16_10550 [Rhodospirillaceae bacterium TMED256]|nr:MAG: hypothetical protein CBE16_10550 [Rhodospirillaceae bacterium TMED256]
MSLFSDFRSLNWDLEKLVIFDQALKDVVNPIQFRFVEEDNREGMTDYLQKCLDSERDPVHKAVYFSLIQLHNQAVKSFDARKDDPVET